jgi:hypothetical protein
LVSGKIPSVFDGFSGERNFVSDVVESLVAVQVDSSLWKMPVVKPEILSGKHCLAYSPVFVCCQGRPGERDRCRAIF